MAGRVGWGAETLERADSTPHSRKGTLMVTAWAGGGAAPGHQGWAICYPGAPPSMQGLSAMACLSPTQSHTFLETGVKHRMYVPSIWPMEGANK